MEVEMLFPHIMKLYLYRPANDNTLNILRHNRLWASKPDEFNDPFDCDLEIAEYITEEIILAAINERYGEREQWPDEISQFINSTIDAAGNFTEEERDRLNYETNQLIDKNLNSGIVCLSEICDSIRMWSHYAQGHTGVCFEFSRAYDNDLGDVGLCSPVQYGSHYPQIDLGRMLIYRDGQTIDLMMRYKSSDWSEEKEWRLITDSGDMECPLPAPISRVILGIRVEDPFKSDIETLCNAQDIPYVQAMKVDREFRIQVPPV